MAVLVGLEQKSAGRITFDRDEVSDDDLIAALHQAAATFGTSLTLRADCEVFKRRMARLATRLGYKVKNPELQEYIGTLQPPKSETVVAFPGAK